MNGALVGGAGSFASCLGIDLGVMIFVSLVGHFSAFLLITPPPKRDHLLQCSPRTYGLHLSALWNAALALPIGFAWNAVKNDLLALMPLLCSLSVSPFIGASFSQHSLNN